MVHTQSKISLQQRVDGILANPAESFADKYSSVRKLVSETGRKGRSELVEMVGGMYKTAPLSALGFTYYGRLSELGPEVLGQLGAEDESRASLAIETVRELNLASAYQELTHQLADRKDNPLEGNVLIAMFKLKPTENLQTLREYLSRAEESQAKLVCSNILYDLSKDKATKIRQKVRDIIYQTPLGKALYESASAIAKKLLKLDKQ